MFPTSIKHALENIGSLYKNWRAAGSGCIAASFNIVCLGLLWLMAPLESEPLASLRRNKAFFYPQVDFNAPKLFDPLRIFIQTVFLLAVLPPRGHGPRLVRTVVDILRAAGDARFTMAVSILSMWVFRVAFCYLMVLKFHCGLLFIWMGMFLDWAMRSLFFCVRFVRGRWMEQKVI